MKQIFVFFKIIFVISFLVAA